MPQAIVNPEELRRFAQLLKRFDSELAERSTSLAGQLDALQQTWRDQEHQRFVEEFTQQHRAILRFLETNEQHIAYLLRKAERIDEYLQQR